jgi:hypothetical protein
MNVPNNLVINDLQKPDRDLIHSSLQDIYQNPYSYMLLSSIVQGAYQGTGQGREQRDIVITIAGIKDKDGNPDKSNL